MKKIKVGFLIALALSASIWLSKETVQAADSRIIEDDFSTSNSLWKYLGDAKRLTDGTVLLTPSDRSKTGTIWLNDTIAPPYTVTFKFLMKTGGPFWTQGADGITFMFNKKQNLAAVAGGGMGFEIGNGYGVEFDSYSNSYDPEANHISLFKNNPDHEESQPLAQILDTTFENSSWHNVKVNVGVNSVKVYMDNLLKVDWSGKIDPKYNGLGFTASTGYFHNAQYIDDVKITKPASVTGVSSTQSNGFYSVGTVIPLQITFDDKVQVTGSPRLFMQTGNSAAAFASYAGGSGTQTLTFNYTVLPGDQIADLNYKDVNALSLNGGTILDSVGNPVNLSLPATNASNSLGGNKQIGLDTIAPSGTISINPANLTFPTVKLALSANDGIGSGVAQMHFSNDNAVWTSWESYAPSTNYDLPKFIGPKIVYVQFKDLAGNISSSISAKANPPEAQNKSFTTLEDTVISNQSLTATSPDGRSLTYEIVTNPLKGSLTLNASGSFAYTPFSNLNGTDTFVYKVSDGIMYSNTAVVTITIIPVNDPPVALAGSLTLPEDGFISGKLTASDVEGDPLTYSIVSKPSHGTISGFNPLTGTYVYTTNTANYYGSDSFTFRVYDGTNYSTTQTISVNIMSVNDAPVSFGQTLITLEDTPLSGNLTASDVDAGDTKIYSVVSNGSKGHVVIVDPSTGVFTYTPIANISGQDTFTFKVIDGGNLSSNISTVAITITAVNDPPVFVKGADLNVRGAAIPQSIPGWASSISPGPEDEANQKLTFELNVTFGAEFFSILPAITPQGTLTFTPASNASGTAQITVKLKDDGGGTTNISAVQSFTITFVPSTISFSQVNLSPAIDWTKEKVTVSANVYSSSNILQKKWAAGEHRVTEFTYNYGTSLGTVFTDSFDVIYNGTYTLYAINVDGGVTVTNFSIANIDKVNPTIKLIGDAQIIVEAGSSFTDPGAIVFDDSLPPEGVPITAVASDVNTLIVGKYTMTYSYKDRAANTASVTRSVYVEDHTRPVITLLGESIIKIGLNSTYIEPGYTVQDQPFSIPASRVTVSENVYTSEVKTYTLTYKVIDDSGNESLGVTRTVEILDNLPPLISDIQISPYEWTTGPTTITAKFNGTGTDLSIKKWAKGNHDIDYFRLDGTSFDGVSFKATSNDIYTLYAKDAAGNETVARVTVDHIDTTPPAGGIVINDGASFTHSLGVTLKLFASDMGSGVQSMRISEDSTFASVSWQVYGPTLTWNLQPGEGVKTMYYQLKDLVGNESAVYSASILMDAYSSDLKHAYDDLLITQIIGENTRADQIVHNVMLPGTGSEGTTIAWVSSHKAISLDGNINQPTLNEGDAHVTLTATITKGEFSITKSFALVVPRQTSTLLKLLEIETISLSPAFEPNIFNYKASVGHLITSLTLHTEPEDQRSSLNIIGATLANGSYTIDLKVGDNPVIIIVESADHMQRSVYNLNIYKEREYAENQYFGNLFIFGGALAPSFDPGITEYQIYADELNKSINLLPFQVSSKVQLNIAGEGVKSTFTDGVFHIDINGISSFKLEVRSLENKTLLKTYQFSISNWLSLAAAHADGTEAVLILKKELDTTYVMDPARFAFDQAGVTVMGAQYDMQDTTHHTIRLKMSTNKGLAPNVNTIKLNAEEAARTLDGNPISFKNAPVISPEANAALRHQLDPRQNGIHIDDIVTFIETRTDVNGDGIFDQYDVLWLLKQI